MFLTNINKLDINADKNTQNIHDLQIFKQIMSDIELLQINLILEVK